MKAQTGESLVCAHFLAGEGYDAPAQIEEVPAMPILALLVSAALSLGLGVLPARLTGRRPSGADLAAGVAAWGGVWVWAFLFFGKPGLLVNFGLFRAAALCAAAAAASVCVCGWRLTRRCRGGRRRALAAGMLVASALAVEVFFGNVKYFTTHDYQPVQLFDYLDPSIPRNPDGSVTLSGESTVLHFSGLDQPLYNLQLDRLQYPVENAAVQNPLFLIEIAAADEANENEWLGGSWDVALRAPRSWNRALDFAGNISSLTLTALAYDGEFIWYTFQFTITGVTANAPQPFLFSWVRFGVLLAAGAAAWAFRPGSSLWRARYLDNPRRFRPGVILCAGLLCLLAVLTPFADPAGSGVATASYNANNWDGVSRISFTKHISDWQHDADNQLGALASSLLAGRLDLQLDPPDSLAGMENPYDTIARQYQAPDALWDVAYYNGRYYVYFGVVPGLLFQLPFELLTGIPDLPNCVGMIVMALATVAAGFGLVRQAIRRWFPGASAAAYLLSAAAVGGSSLMYYLLFQPNVYQNVILSGAAFVMLALWQWLASANTPADRPGPLLAHLAAGSLCMALAAGCRPQMEIFAFLALPIFWPRYITGRRLFSRRGIGELALALLPFVLVAAGLMWYNWARFGSPFDFGANYNLTSNDMTKRGFNAGRIGPALFYYLFAPPALQAVFPYLADTHMATNYVGRSVSELLYGGILSTTPFLWSFGLLPLLRRRLARKKLRALVGWVLAASVLLCALDAVMAGVLQRYLMDFALPLTFAAALCWLAAEETLADHAAGCRPVARLQAVLRTGLALSVGAGAVYGFCLVFAAAPWLYGQNPGLFQTVSRLVQFWV